MTKNKNRKRKHETPVEEEKEPEPPPLSRSSDEPPAKKERWLNKQRVLVVASRGIKFVHRHLMQDLRSLMPHSRPENKIERKENLTSVNEICGIKNCNKAVLFEARHHDDLYMWTSNVPDGPSAKFLVENVYTMGEMKLVGNCLRASRPLLSFDDSFDKFQHYALLKEMFIQIFGVPYHHPKSQPFVDHVYSFSVFDNRIWFRNYQILSEDGALTEIGPRFVLNPIKIFNGSFGGETIWTNPHYVTPAMHRRQLLKQAKAKKFLNKITSKVHNEMKKKDIGNDFDEVTALYGGDPLEQAQEILQHEQQQEVLKQQEKPTPSPNVNKKKAFKSKKLQVAQSNGVGHKNVNGKAKKKQKQQGSNSTKKFVVNEQGSSRKVKTVGQKAKKLIAGKKKLKRKKKSASVS